MNEQERRARALIGRYASLRRFEVWPSLTEFVPKPYPVPEPKPVTIDPQADGERIRKMPCVDGRNHRWQKPPYRGDWCSECKETSYHLRVWCGPWCKEDAAANGGCWFCAEVETRLNRRVAEDHVLWELGKAIWAANEEKEQRRYAKALAWWDKRERDRQRKALRQGRRTLTEIRAVLTGRRSSIGST